MRITAEQLRSRTTQILKRAAAGEEFTVTVDGTTSARILPATRFDPKRRKRAIKRIRAFHDQLTKKGGGATQAEIRAVIEESRK